MDKKLYITTAIPYVNGNPHIGNALDYLLADIWARYQRQNGHEVRYQTGTDEHGNKIAAKAAEVGTDPQSYTDGQHLNFKAMIEKVNATATDFIRTTDPHHMAAVQYIWQKLAPYIYKGSYEGWYCMGHEAFFTDKEVSARLKVSRRTLQDYRNEGRIAYIQLGGKILYRESDIERMLNDGYRSAYRQAVI